MRGRELAFAIVLPAALCGAWTVYAGKDVNWDLLNYHYYLPFELLGGRLSQDFFAASGQSYLNPLGYVPFYLMVSAGWHSVLVSVVLAVAHSLNLALLYVLARRLFAHLPPRQRVVFASLAAALGAATAVFWAMVGSSFLDPLLAAPMLGGLAALLEKGGRPWRRAALAGALFGAAAALKYSNAIFALAAFPLALAMPALSPGARLRAGLAYAGAGILAVAILAGPWLALVLREFGNPVFPMMNAWFRSPYAPPVNLISLRFTPESLADALRFPLRMATLNRSLYSEIFAPDVRFAALLACALALPAAALLRRAKAENRLRGSDWRLFAFVGVAWVLWLATSGNARYGLVVLLLGGVCAARLVERLLPPAPARVALVALLAVQLAMSALAAPTRWFLAAPWSSRWLPYKAPERALREPALYLSVELLPMAVVAPFLDPASSFVNLGGQEALPADSPRLAALLARYRGRVRALGRGLAHWRTGLAPGEIASYDRALERVGYRLDPRDCYTVAWQPDESDAVSRAANRIARVSAFSEPLSVGSCALVPASPNPLDLARERRVSAVFARIESACPALFHGQTAVTEPFGARGWARNYNGLDARLVASGDQVMFERYRAGEILELGSLSAWERQKGLPAGGACRPAEAPGS